MNQQLFSILVQGWADYLSGEENVKFEELIELGKSNRRIRNISGLFALASEKTFKTLTQISQIDKLVDKNIRVNLAKALTRLAKESNPEISSFANYLKSKYFPNIEPFVNDENDASAEMVKLFKTIINSYSLANKNNDEDFQNRVRATMDKFDLSFLS